MNPELVIQVFLLGESRFQIGPLNAPVRFLLPPTRKTQSLLAYLIIFHHQAHLRTRLMGMFWGDRPERRARRSLSTGLWHIRRCFAPADPITADNHAVQFDWPGELWLDTAAFARAAQSPELTELETAVSLYRGDFLDGFYDDWVINERYRLQTLYLDALARLMQLYAAAVRPQHSLQTALTLLNHDSLREDAHRAAVRAYARLGRRSDALRQFEQCRRTLAAELGVEPSPETVALHQAILRGELAPVTPEQTAVPPPPLPTRPAINLTTLPLLEREDALAELHTAWQTARNGNGRLIFIRGEPGIGKSRLLAACAEYARQTGGQVFSGGCYEFERRLPYQPLADAIRPVLARLHPDDCAALSGWMLAELRRLVPDWKAAPAAPPAATEPDILFHALYRFLAQLAGTAPVLLIVDDLHWANEATLSLLHYLARHGRQSPLLILCAHREATPPSLTTFHQQLQQAGLADAITLARLSPVGVQSLVRQLVTDADTAVPLAGYLFTETEGNPFFLAEMLKSLQENGILTRQDGRWQIDVSRLTPAILPGSIKTAVAHRLHRLPPAAQTLAGVTAVLGRACHYDLLHTVWPQDKEAMLAGLDDLLRAQILREADEWDYAFTHHKIQEAIYDDLPRHRRLHLHAQAGRALAQMADAQPAELAHHLAQGAKVDKSLVAPAAAAIFRAGEQAAAQFAYADALDYFKRALDLTPDHDQDRQFELLLARENARHILADRQAQAADLDRLDSLTPRLTVSQQIEAALRRSRFSHATGDYAAAIAAAQTAVHLAAEQGHTSLEAEGYWRWGMALRAQSSSKPAQRQLEKALNLARKAALPKLEAQCWRNLGLVSVDLGDYAAAKTHYAQSLRIFRRLGLHRREAQTLGNVSIIHRSEGDYAQAQRYLEQALQVFRQIGDRYQEGIVLLNLGVILWDQSDLPQGRAYLEDSLQICREIEDRSGAALALNNLGRLIAEQGNYPTATDYLNRALTIYDQIDERKGESITWQSLGNVRAAQGAYDDAVANYRQALAIRRGIGDRRGEGYCLRGLGDNALAIREYALAGESFTGALAIFREIGEQRGVGETLRGLGAWAASLGAFEQARDYFEQALQLFHSPRDEATVYAPLADLWRQMGDDQAAMAYGRRALEAAQAVGNRSVQAAALTHLGTAQLSLEQPGAAESVLQEALDLRRALSQPHLETEPLAGLARAALRRGDVPAAAQLAELILERVETYGLHGVAHPVRVYLACYHVWQTAHDSRAGAVLAAANTWLQSQANQIQDDDLRRSFLHNIPAHQALLTLF